MTRKKWSYLAVGMVAIASFLFAYNAQAKYVASKSLTVTVNIEKHYEVAFDANGGTGTMANQQFTTGVAQALTTNAYVRDGQYFAGWNTSADGSGVAYADGATISEDLTNVGGSVVTLYAQWEEDAMHTVFKIEGTCVFHGYDIQQGTGDGYITGNDCSTGGINWADGTHKYIDTGVKLYDSTNYEKDYEVGFTITAYDSAHQYKEPGDSSSQATFFNSKFEDANRHWPGVVIRKNADKIELTQTIKKGSTYEKKTGTGPSTTTKVVLTRVDGILYYSVNGGEFQLLQDMQNTSDYFETVAWFGAGQKGDNGLPMRYIDATMTDIYIKVGEKGANKHTVSFDAGGVVADPADATIIGTSKIGNALPGMPNYVDTTDGRLYFIGWYSGVDGAGDKYDEDSIIGHDVTLHAFWNDELIVCSVGGDTYGDLQTCIDEAGAGDTITLFGDLRAQINVASDKDITLDLDGHKLSDNSVANTPVIENFGKITIVNGTITSTLRAGVLNNNSTGEMHIGNDARIVATGSRQAVYNNGGRLEISGNAYLSAVSNERAAVQNLNNGQLVITGGTIISTKQEAVKVESGTLTIGVEDGVADSSAPILQGATYGVNTSVNISMFDGKLRGKTAAINNTSRITATEDGATAVGIDAVATEVVDGETYNVVYYQ
ncbi:InlB B-repeat-containing protein [Candidatus Saccharibacteria bacterium]|nr:InlB B-repeat-containing protein [Candidatus Saccharibacteria bacterium]MBR6961359.1 InlB B-repeat-containing protein [Candidatus Saccharibacteria bacterium]